MGKGEKGGGQRKGEGEKGGGQRKGEGEKGGGQRKGEGGEKRIGPHFLKPSHPLSAFLPSPCFPPCIPSSL